MTGRVLGMAKEKVTITLDRGTISEVIRLTGATSTSAAIDRALRELLRSERTKRDVEAYLRIPQTSEEMELVNYQPTLSDLDDDTDWAALYPDIK